MCLTFVGLLDIVPLPLNNNSNIIGRGTMGRDNSYLIGNQFAKGNKPNNTVFKAGSIPWNKGLKGIRLSIKSEFKKGNPPPKKYEIGKITQRKSKNNKIRSFIKVAERNWQIYSKYLWEQRYGKLLRNDVVHHINGNVLDDRIDNLIALPRTDHPIYHNKWGSKPIPTKQMLYYLKRYQS